MHQRILKQNQKLHSQDRDIGNPFPFPQIINCKREHIRIIASAAEV